MDISQLQSFLLEMGVNRVVTMISRRAAGVWTLLPSLTFQNLSDLDGQATVLLIDFGLRHEMLQHLQTDPIKLSPEYSLLRICSSVEKVGKKPITLLEYHRDFIAESTRVIQLLPGAEDPGNEYRQYVRDFSIQGKQLLLCPFISGPSNEALQSPTINLSALVDGLRAIVQVAKPDFVYLTFEGQPERPLFDEKLANDEIMRFCLDLCDIILSLVRTDAPTRFEEGIAVPSLLAENQQWESKIRLFLTRHPEEISIPLKLNDVVIGQSPFLDLIGQSLQSGRIPWIDFTIKRYGEMRKELVARYFAGLQQASREIVNV